MASYVLAVLGVLAIASLAGCGEQNQNDQAAILDLATGDLRRISDRESFAHEVSWSRDSNSVVVIEGNDAVSRKATTGASVWRVKGDSGWYLREAAFSPDGDVVAVLQFNEPSFGSSTALDILSAADGRLAESGRVWSIGGAVRVGFTPMIHDLAWASDGRVAVIGVVESRADLFVLDQDAGWAATSERTIEHEFQVEAAFTGGSFAVLGEDGLVLYEPGVPGRVIRPGRGEANVDFAFSPDGERIVLLKNARLSIYDLDRQEWTPLHDAPANSVSWGADGTIAFSWGGAVYGINHDGTHLRVLLEVGNGQSVRDLEWSPDGTKLALIVQPRYRD